MKNLRAYLLCSIVAPATLACSDDIPPIPENNGSTGGTGTTVTTNMSPGTATDMPGTTTAATTTDADSGTTVTLDGTTEVATTEIGTTEVGTTEVGTTEGIDDDTIYEIQDGTIATGMDVDVRGVVVTGVSGNAFFAQEPAGGEYSGVYVYIDAVPTVAVGDEVDILGTTVEFNDLTEIDASMGMVIPTGVTGIDLTPDVVTQADLAGMAAEPWECVLVRIEGAPLDVVDLSGGSEFEVNGGGADDTRIDNFLYSIFDFPAMYPDFGLEASFTAIQGPLNFNFGTFKIAPRSAADFEGYMGGPPAPGESIENLVPGDLVITEIMYDPFCAGDDCEWIEVYNASGIEVNLFGLRIQDSGMSPMNQGMVGENVLVAPGAYALLGREDMGSWPYMVTPDAFYGSSPGLNNGGAGDLAIILNSMEILDQTASYPVFGAADDGIAWKLDPMMIDAMSNDDAANWCHSTNLFESPGGMDEYGTPGAVNDAACAML